MNGISSKLGGGAIAGAIVGILVWVVGLTGLIIPPEVAAYIVVIVSFGIGFLVPETATTNAEGATLKAVVSVDPADAEAVADTNATPLQHNHSQ